MTTNPFELAKAKLRTGEFFMIQATKGQLESLSSYWENSLIDQSKYTDHVGHSNIYWVNPEFYHFWKQHGGYCQVSRKKFFIGLKGEIAEYLPE